MGNPKLCFNLICSPLVCYYVCNGESCICLMWKFWLQTRISANIGCSGHKLYIREQEGLKMVLNIIGSLSCVSIRSTPHLPASTCYKSMSMFSRHIRFCSIQARRSLHSSSASDRRRISFGSGCRLFHRRNRPPPYISYLKLPSLLCPLALCTSDGSTLIVFMFHLSSLLSQPHFLLCACSIQSLS